MAVALPPDVADVAIEPQSVRELIPRGTCATLHFELKTGGTLYAGACN